ncbi:MAG: DUF1905 domain-containing protein [Chloroflexi bacterium]|nr:DUF1905 domain-containing protein [Chloroflexota bacterium]
MVKKPSKFSGKICKLDINPCVDVPEKIVQELLRAANKERGPIPVKGRLNGKEFRTTVVKFRGAWRLYLNTYMRAEAGIDVGDRARVQIWFDPNPRSVPIPKVFAKALDENPAAKAAFEKSPPSHQREILRYMNWIKRPETLQRNIDKAIAHLLGRETFASRKPTKR